MNPFDQTETEPYDELVTQAQAEAILELASSGNRVMDLGCGIGRVARHLSSDLELLGIDRHAGVLEEFSKVTDGARTHQLDFMVEPSGMPDGPFHGVMLLGNTFMEMVDPIEALSFLREIANRLEPDGFFAIDDFPCTLWDEVAVGNWCTGIDEDESMQLIWQGGDPIFILRRGTEVDPDSWSPRPEDSRFRLWSMGELRLLASLAGLESPVHDPPGHLLVMKRS